MPVDPDRPPPRRGLRRLRGPHRGALGRRPGQPRRRRIRWEYGKYRGNRRRPLRPARLHRYDLAAATLDLIAPELGSPRALLAFHDAVYFTVPSAIYRLQPTAKSPTFLADLGMLGVHPEALATDGEHLYTTLVMNGGGGPGIVVRVPLAGGEPEVVVADAGIAPWGLVVDQACLYWIDWQGGTVQRARKDPGPP